ncbi:MAG: class I SAM-dependent methyltransferase [Planctomycetota bacterium]|jgi:SAM-dependent methyltransferase|nr:class I SAM-dependent methyltransferase [Planctomycetota bacterium]
MTDTRDWWEAAFAELYLELYAHRDDGSAAAEVAGVLPMLSTAPGPVLDACCGNGRHLAAMREAGLRAWGFDLSPQLLTVANERPACQGRLARGDVRRPPLAGSFGAITLFFTAFGYFPDGTNAAALTGLAALLAPGGVIMLDLPDPDHLARNLVPHSERHTASGLRVMELRRMVDKRVEKTVTALADDGTSERYTESVRLYGPGEIADLAQLAGLEVEACWGSLRGLNHDDKRRVYWLRQTGS